MIVFCGTFAFVLPEHIANWHGIHLWKWAMFCKFYRYSCSSTKYALGICEYFSLVFVIAKVEMKRKIGLVFYPFDICILFSLLLLTRMSFIQCFSWNIGNVFFFEATI
jgi:hypothetical protein